MCQGVESRPYDESANLSFKAAHEHFMNTKSVLPLLLVLGVSVTAGYGDQQAPRLSAGDGNHDGLTTAKSPTGDARTTTGEAKMSSAPKKADLVVTRVFAAPVERVWKAWTDSGLVKQWWGPTGFTCPVARIDFREGATSLVCMRAPKAFGGQDIYNTWTYEKIVPMNRFVYIHRFSDKEANPTDPVKQGLSPEIPREMRIEVSFRELGKDKTEVKVTEYGWPVGPMMEMSRTGLQQCLDKMAALLGG
jgi:uncharacterized protein YndB with AHSA1/START domain